MGLPPRPAASPPPCPLARSIPSGTGRAGGWAEAFGAPPLPPHLRLAPSRLQEEMLQREEAENTLQSFRQVSGGGGGRGPRRWWLCLGRRVGVQEFAFLAQRGFRQFSRKPSVFSLGGCCSLRGGEVNYCPALSKSSPFYKKHPNVESLSDPIKVKGGHLLAWLKGINGFYGIHRGMQIQAL